MLVGWLAIGLAGLFIQLRYTGRMKPLRATVRKDSSSSK
jgi:hypothetical protein